MKFGGIILGMHQTEGSNFSTLPYTIPDPSAHHQIKICQPESDCVMANQELVTQTWSNITVQRIMSKTLYGQKKAFHQVSYPTIYLRAIDPIKKKSTV